MAMAQIQKLRRFINANPALADVPFGIVQGQPITPREALQKLRLGLAQEEVTMALEQAGLDPEPQDWELTEAYYRKLLELPGPKPSIYVIPEGEIIGKQITLEEALIHVRRRDETGRSLLKNYQGLLGEMGQRMRKYA